MVELLNKQSEKHAEPTSSGSVSDLYHLYWCVTHLSKKNRSLLCLLTKPEFNLRSPTDSIKTDAEAVSLENDIALRESISQVL